MFTDGSSFVKDGVRRAGYATVITHSITEEKPCHLTFQPKAESIALTQASTPGEGKIVNINTNSKYAFFVLHAHTAIWKEKRLPNVRNSPVKYEAEILHLIEVVQKPKQVAVTPATGSKMELLKFPKETTGRIRKQRKQL